MPWMHMANSSSEGEMKETQMRCAGGARQAACWSQGQPAPSALPTSMPSFALTPCTEALVRLESQSLVPYLGTLHGVVSAIDWLATHRGDVQDQYSTAMLLDESLPRVSEAVLKGLLT